MSSGVPPDHLHQFCSFCGVAILHARTPDDVPVILDLSKRTWCLVYREGAAQPKLALSRAYPEHCCQQQGG